MAKPVTPAESTLDADPEVPSLDELGHIDTDAPHPIQLDTTSACRAGDEAFKAGNLQIAQHAWERAAKDPQAALNASVLLVWEGTPEARARARELLLGAAKRDPRVWTNAAVLADESNDSDMVDWLKRADAGRDVIGASNLLGRTGQAPATSLDTPHPVATCALGAQSFAQKNSEQAFKLFKSAADGGYPSGLYRSGGCMLRGLGTRYDPNAGWMLVARAASLGDRRAQRRLARCYLVGTPRCALNTRTAMAWLILARPAWELEDHAAYETLLDRLPREGLAAAAQWAGQIETQSLYAGVAWHANLGGETRKSWIRSVFGR